jgi:hypothetical protein
MKALRILGCLWASPLTILGLVYALVLNMVGWIKWYGVAGNALVWVHNKPPKWFLSRWKRYRAKSFGQIVVLRTNPNHDVKSPSLPHELIHVNQMMIFGIFYPFIWFMNWIVISLLSNSNTRYDSPFEIDARRGAGQFIDMTGLTNKIKTYNKEQDKKM